MTQKPEQLARPELALPSLLTRDEVCHVARCGRGKLAAEIVAGRMPSPVRRGRQSLFNRDAVLTALGIIGPPTAAEQLPPATLEAIARELRGGHITQAQADQLRTETDSWSVAAKLMRPSTPAERAAARAKKAEDKRFAAAMAAIKFDANGRRIPPTRDPPQRTRRPRAVQSSG